MNANWWEPSKPMVYVPINLGPDDEPFQTSAPEEMTFEEAEKRNFELQSFSSTWRWFCWAEMGSA